MFLVEKETITTYFVCHVNNPKQYVFEIFGKHFGSSDKCVFFLMHS